MKVWFNRFLLAQEAVKNACNHGKASTVWIALRYEARQIQLIVSDNGHGFDVARVLADGNCGIGLRNMRERADALGGSCVVHAGRQGTRITATLPLPPDLEGDAATPHTRFDSSYAPA